ncbi:MAG: DegT/DnrJ/EryC1/StrS family aminotransferase [Armatimonadetes bacterium]|jgi:dTDP-4-amino-4,6-dideoxygalactose transaminase|nr:DegT/DnrJ/EryC1/StrS family aminotransferase [Armatimonadota bacterium]
MADLAIKGGSKAVTGSFPGWPIWDESDCQAVEDVVRSGQWWSVGGTRVPEFERKFAEYQGAKFGVCVPNGTISLLVALQAVGVKAGDEVIVTPYTFIASASAIVQANAIPVFVDVDLETFNIDPKQIEAAITDKTKAIMAVHIGGLPADMDAIMEIARKHNLKVIEDAAQAHGASWNGHGVGSIGDIGSFSFQASKNLTSGEGGIVTTNDQDIADIAWSIHNVGRVKGGAWYEHLVLGCNYRMTEFQAAILLNQMKKLDAETKLRNENGLYLDKRLSKIDGIAPQKRDERVTSHAYHIFALRYTGEEKTGVSRDKVLEALTAEGVPVSIGYLPLYRAGVFELSPEDCPLGCRFYGRTMDYTSLVLPNCERLSDSQAIWIPQNVMLSDRNTIDEIANAFEKVIENIEQLKD